MGPVKRTTKNPFFNSMYADLATVLDAIRPKLGENDLALIQAPDVVDGKVGITTMLMHVSGEWIKSGLYMTPKDAQNPQVLGSILTYIRRYSAPGYAMIASEDDDDGNAAAVKEEKKEAKEEKKEEAPKPEGKSSSGVSAGQLKFMQTLFGRAGYKEDLDKHAYATGVADREITSLKSLTFKEASVVIDSLVKLTAQPPTS